MNNLTIIAKKYTEYFMRLMDIENIEMLVVNGGIKVSYLGSIQNNPLRFVYKLEDKASYIEMSLNVSTEKSTIIDTKYKIVSEKDLKVICNTVKMKLPRNTVQLKQEILVFNELTKLEGINLICMSQQFIRIMFKPNNMIQSIDLLISNDTIHLQVQTIRKLWDAERSYNITEIDKILHNVKSFYQYVVN